MPDARRDRRTMPLRIFPCLTLSLPRMRGLALVCWGNGYAADRRQAQDDTADQAQTAPAEIIEVAVVTLRAEPSN